MSRPAINVLVQVLIYFATTPLFAIECPTRFKLLVERLIAKLPGKTSVTIEGAPPIHWTIEHFIPGRDKPVADLSAHTSPDGLIRVHMNVVDESAEGGQNFRRRGYSEILLAEFLKVCPQDARFSLHLAGTNSVVFREKLRELENPDSPNFRPDLTEKGKQRLAASRVPSWKLMTAVGIGEEDIETVNFFVHPKFPRIEVIVAPKRR